MWKLLLTAAFTLLTLQGAQAAQPAYKLDPQTLSLPGIGRWDYLTYDSSGRRLYIAHGDHVDVVDPDAGKVVGSIPNTQGVHGIAIVPDLRLGFVSDGKANAVTVFRTDMLQTVNTIAVGRKPDSIAYDPYSHKIFAADGDDDALTAINPQSGTVIGTIPLGGGPETIVADGKGMLFVNLEDKSQLAAVDASTLAVTAHYDLAPACTQPGGLAIDRANERLFAACQNNVVAIINGRTGKVEGTAPIGSHPDAAVFDPATGLAFASNGDGTLSVIGQNEKGEFLTLQTVQTRLGARTMALDPAAHIVYLVTGQSDGMTAATPDHPSRPKFRDDSVVLIKAVPSEVKFP